jgi:Fe-Mn family superoxide dismutase
MKHILQPLPFGENDLAPILSQESMRYHHGAHHLAYVNNLNKFIVGTEFENLSLEDIIKKATPGLILNNAAQHWNHSFYWNCLTPKKMSLASGLFFDSLEKRFGNLLAFKEAFNKSALSVFGSGWAWLVVDLNNNLEIKTTGNADNPLRVGDIPILTCDVWEHAYYIDYKNARDKYLISFWEIINWEFVAQNYFNSLRKR